MGLIGFLLRFIGPLTVAPTITLIGIALVRVAVTSAGEGGNINQNSSLILQRSTVARTNRSTVKFRLYALGLYNFLRLFWGGYIFGGGGGAYIRKLEEGLITRIKYVFWKALKEH